MKQLVFTSILMLVVMAADTEEDMEITFTFERYVDLKRLKTSKYDMVHYNILYITYNQNVSVNSALFYRSRQIYIRNFFEF